MDVLLSIKPKYADKIISGEKKYEFRKTKLDKNKVNNIYIYSSSPVKKIIGKVTLSDILEGPPKIIWRKCRKYSGISEEEFFNYFAGKDLAFALAIEDVEHFIEPIDPYIEFDNFIPPQSYCYWNKTFN